MSFGELRIIGYNKVVYPGVWWLEPWEAEAEAEGAK